MKILVILFSCFVTCASWGGPVDPIQPPWPLGTLPLNRLEFPGRWLSVNSNTVFIVDIDLNGKENGISEIKIRSNTRVINYAKGWVKEQKRGIFAGQVVDGNKLLNVMIFRDDEGTKLRIADTRGYFDLKLLKNQ